MKQTKIISSVEMENLYVLRPPEMHKVTYVKEFLSGVDRYDIRLNKEEEETLKELIAKADKILRRGDFYTSINRYCKLISHNMHKNSRDYLEQECTRLSKELGYTVLFDSINGGLLYHIKIIDQLAKLHKEALG